MRGICARAASALGFNRREEGHVKGLGCRGFDNHQEKKGDDINKKSKAMIINGKEYIYKIDGETYQCAMDVTMNFIGGKW